MDLRLLVGAAWVIIVKNDKGNKAHTKPVYKAEIISVLSSGPRIRSVIVRRDVLAYCVGS